MQPAISPQSNSPSSSNNVYQAPTSSQQQQLLAKLDGVLYHFYSTTANVIIQSRLIQYRKAQQQQRLTKWFALQIAETELFKEELRLWRSVSSMLALDKDGNVSPSSSTSAAVPPLVIDIILDLSAVPEDHLVMLVNKSGTDKPPHFRPNDGTSSTAWDDRVSIDGIQVETKLSNKSGSVVDRLSPGTKGERTTEQIVLERWKLEFIPGSATSPPELPTLYKRSITHFRALFALVHALPTSRLCSRIEAAKSRIEAVAARKAKPKTPADLMPTSTTGESSSYATDQAGELDHELQIGCRLSMAESHESIEGEVGISRQLHAEQIRQGGEDEASTGEATSTRRFSPIVTPIGTLNMSVAFRKLADLSVQDIKSLESVKELQIEMDEDYFRPTIEMVKQRTSSGNYGARPDMGGASALAKAQTGAAVAVQTPDEPAEGTVQPSPEIKPKESGGSKPSTPSGGSSPSRAALELVKEARPRSLLSATAHQCIGGLTAGRLSGAALSSEPSSYKDSMPMTAPSSASITPTPSSSEQIFSRSPGNPSVFSSSAPGRPVAGLSSLRRAGSITGNISHLGNSSGFSGTPSSPALAAALSAEPAFLASGSARRPSTSERRMRSLSGFSSSPKESSSSPTLASMGPPALPSSASVTRGSATGPSSTSTSLRSVSGRISNGSVSVPSPQFRSSSFSPSSPSPLVQQLSMQRRSEAINSSSVASVSGSRLSSSPAFQPQVGGVSVPSLRSVFQTYVPKFPGAASSYSLTPPTSITLTSGQHKSPSSLSTRTANSRRFSFASDAGSVSGLNADSSGARPQMIKRYSTNFGYRQNRDQRSVYGSSLGTGDANQASTAGAEASSLPSSGAGSLGSAYSRSWAARIEQRQQVYGSFARPSNSIDEGTSGSASTSIRFRSSPAAGITPTGALTPSPGSHEEDIDDLMRLLDSKPVLRGAGNRLRSRNDSPAIPEAASGNEEAKDTLSGSSSGVFGEASTGDRARLALASSSSSLSGRNGGKAGIYASIRGTNPLSRSQVDEMLSRMVQSVNLISPSGSGSSGGTRSDLSRVPSITTMRPSSVSGREDHGQTVVPTSAGSRVRPSVRGTFDQPTPAPATGNGSSNAKAVTAYRGNASTGFGPGAVAPGAAREVAARPVGTGQVRGLRTGATLGLTTESNAQEDGYGYRAGGALGLIRDRRQASEVDPDISVHDTAVDPRRHRTASSYSLDNEGDTYSYTELQPTYDPADDETAGRMEFEDDYYLSDRRAVIPDADVEGSFGATTTDASAPTNKSEWERRRADAEMARNFGREVGAGTRGRGSKSPWRHSPAVGFVVPSRRAEEEEE